MIPYKTSKDYKRLKELLDKGEKITVFFLHKSGYGTEQKIRKTAEKKYNEITHCDGYFIGPMTIFPFSQKPFEYYCEKYNIEFIEPNL
mgnify:FL=1|jgi:hypothetical protein